MVEGVSCLRRSPGHGPAGEPIWSSHGDRAPDCNLQCEARWAWTRDVALEISIDVERVPSTIRLAGTLDGATAVNLIAVVAELIRDGHRDFELKTSALCVPDAGGVGALNGLQRLVQGSGGRLAWDGSTANRPFPVKGDNLGRHQDQVPRVQASLEAIG
jgi:hypothetical protein